MSSGSDLSASAGIVPIFQTAIPFVLASGSPRRRELLASVGVDFEVMASDVAEPAWIQCTCETFEGYAMRVAGVKAMAVAVDRPQAAVLGADTIVVCADEIMGKPADGAHALEMLGRLSGMEHRVVTGCALVLPGRSEAVKYAVTSVVVMNAWDERVLKNYVSTGECADKAGAYAIQGIGGFLVREVRGSFSNVVGLPLAETLEVLIGHGVLKR